MPVSQLALSNVHFLLNWGALSQIRVWKGWCVLADWFNYINSTSYNEKKGSCLIPKQCWKRVPPRWKKQHRIGVGQLFHLIAPALAWDAVCTHFTFPQCFWLQRKWHVQISSTLDKGVRQTEQARWQLLRQGMCANIPNQGSLFCFDEESPDENAANECGKAVLTSSYEARELSDPFGENLFIWHTPSGNVSRAISCKEQNQCSLHWMTRDTKWLAACPMSPPKTYALRRRFIKHLNNIKDQTYLSGFLIVWIKSIDGWPCKSPDQSSCACVFPGWHSPGSPQFKSLQRRTASAAAVSQISAVMFCRSLPATWSRSFLAGLQGTSQHPAFINLSNSVLKRGTFTRARISLRMCMVSSHLCRRWYLIWMKVIHTGFCVPLLWMVRTFRNDIWLFCFLFGPTFLRQVFFNHCLLTQQHHFQLQQFVLPLILWRLTMAFSLGFAGTMKARLFSFDGVWTVGRSSAVSLPFLRRDSTSIFALGVGAVTVLCDCFVLRVRHAARHSASHVKIIRIYVRLVVFPRHIHWTLSAAGGKIWITVGYVWILWAVRFAFQVLSTFLASLSVTSLPFLCWVLSFHCSLVRALFHRTTGMCVSNNDIICRSSPTFWGSVTAFHSTSVKTTRFLFWHRVLHCFVWRRYHVGL